MPRAASASATSTRPAMFPGVAMRPDERGPRLACWDVPSVYTDVVAGGDPAPLDARRRVRNGGVGEEDEPIEPHRSAPERTNDVGHRPRQLVWSLRLAEPDDEVVESGLAVCVEVAANLVRV